MSGFSFGLSTVLFLCVLIGEPVLRYLNFHDLSAKIDNEPGARVVFYLRWIVWDWGSVIGIVLILLGLQHPLVSVGLQEPNSAWVIGVGLAAVCAAGLVYPKSRALIQDWLTRSAELLPTGRGEKLLYAGASLTAGICDELLYRGFLIFYLTIVFSWMPVAIILAFSGFIYGVRYAYRGKKAVLLSTLSGLALAILYWSSGSLLPGMILHALADLSPLLLWPNE